jgi:hypothetical protein
VLLFIVGPMALSGAPCSAQGGRGGACFGLLGAAFMLVEVALLRQFVLLLGCGVLAGGDAVLAAAGHRHGKLPRPSDRRPRVRSRLVAALFGVTLLGLAAIVALRLSSARRSARRSAR